MSTTTAQTLPEAPAPRSFEGPMTWEDVCAHPSLRDLPFRIETNERGQIVMSPTSNRHSLFQGEIAYLLRKHLDGGRPIPECSITTAEGVKVADVAWASDDFLKKHEDEFAYSIAPPICVEVRSPSNSDAEMTEKVTLYLAKGAQEVWICDLEGAVAFFAHEGAIERSRLAPDFPRQITLGS